MLGLDRPQGQPGSGSSGSTHDGPTVDSLRERSFSGFDSYLEPDQPKAGARRILLLIALLVALGGAAWWTYTNYLGATDNRKALTTTRTGPSPADNMATKPPVQNSAPAPETRSSQESASQPIDNRQQSTEHATSIQNNASPDATPEASSAPAKSANIDAEKEPASPAAPTSSQPSGNASRGGVAPAEAPAAKSVPSYTRASKHESTARSSKPANLPPPPVSDSGDAEFRRGEAYLYGRGLPENCSEAVKNLKAASAKSNAKARSAFGTMYATGHCVPRDLPTSYLWFALALRVDPNNQILEKDLSAVWNQMTPPERQMATRMKQ
jgi:hypothetical protein